MPCLVSTFETDGRLPSGETMQYAIETMDKATHHCAAYYMINCAHPTDVCLDQKRQNHATAT
jgi:homocysteine S-methyltransferase